MGWAIIFFFLILPQAAFPQSDPMTYRQGPFKGKVIDSETKEPIGGAIVVAEYYIDKFTIIGWRSNRFDVREALTDMDGIFHLPLFSKELPALSQDNDVAFLIWKPGYKRVRLRGGYFFAKEPGTVETRFVYTKKGYEPKPVRLGIVELIRTRNIEERRLVPVAPVGDEDLWVHQKYFIKMIREEWEFITGKPAGDLYMIKEGRHEKKDQN